MARAAPPLHDELPNFDRRVAPAESARSTQATAITEASPQDQAVFDDAGVRVGDARVDRDPITGSPAFVSSTTRFLTGAGGAPTTSTSAAQAAATTDAHQTVRAFIDRNQALFGHRSDILTGTRVKRDYVTAHSGLRTVVWEQQLDGIMVFEATFQANLTSRGELVNLASRLVVPPEPATLISAPAISAQAAVAIAARNIGEVVAAAEPSAIDTPQGNDRKQHFRAASLNDAEARLVWLPYGRSNLSLAWEVILTSKARGQLFRVLVDAETGEVVVRHCLTEDIGPASYRVFTSDSPSPFSPGHATPLTTQPALVSRNLVTLSALNTTASPNGWIDDGVIETRGNNVDAHTDTDADDQADLPRPQATGANRVFDPALDLTQAPSTYADAAVVNLFYWNNWMHDKLYELGFTEAAGNFQNNNFGRGGLGNDAVQADAQDGSGSNNANFSTPPDGRPGRMQMYVFNYPTPDRDGDFDAEIVLHEYTHGLSNRLVGGGVGMSALQSRGMGEGWSDFYAMTLLSESSDDIKGNYPSGGYASYMMGGSFSQNYYYGIRRYPYSTDMSKNPLTFKDIDPSQASTHAEIPRNSITSNTATETHNMGEVWCVTLWDMRANLVSKHGFTTGNQLALQLVTDGMKLSPANPNFLQARDAIIQADLVKTGGANKAELWAAFAKRGMGFSAASPASGTTTELLENFDLPDDLSVTPATTFAATGGRGGPFTPAARTYTLFNTSAAPLNWTATKTQAWTSLSATAGTLAAGATTTVILSINSAANSLPAGTYTDTATFHNITSGVNQQRPVSLAALPPPVIYSHPATQTIYAGVTLSLSVSASGTGTLLYQWLKDGASLTNGGRIAGADSSTLSISATQTTDAGLYRVIVSNSGGGSTTSNAATLIVNIPPPPVITTHPALNTAAYVGGSLSLSASASGHGLLLYQWQKAGVNLPLDSRITGSHASSLSINPVQTGDAGQYRLVVTNAGGSATSNAATVAVNLPPPPVFSSQPTDTTVTENAALTLTGTATSPTPITYQWSKDGTVLASQTWDSLYKSAAALTDAGQYQLSATNAGGSVSSRAAIVTVVPTSGTTTIAPATRIVGCGRVVYPITLRCNTDWTATKSATWITLPIAAGKFSRTIEVIVAPNPLPVERTATITIGLQTHTLTQRAAGTPIRELWAIGANDLGQLGDYRLPSNTFPAKADDSVKVVAAGQDHTLYVKTDGTLWATGENSSGHLGDGTHTDRSLPVQVASNVKAIAGGSYHTAILKTDGTLWTVGANFDGQLANGTTVSRTTPAQEAAGVVAIAAGAYSTFFVKTDGTLWAAGYNFNGQLGDGTTTRRPSPVQIATNVASVASGWAHTLFVKTDGTLWATGDNFYGQLGDSTTTDHLSPVQIATGVKAVACGEYHSLFLKVDGSLFAVGYNYSGQLGDGTTIGRTTPVGVDTGVQSMSAGSFHTLYIKNDGTLWASGVNQYYKLGDGTTTTRNRPVKIDSNVQAVAAGDDHTLYIKRDDSLWAMGSNRSGQLGYASPGTDVRATPICIASEVQSAAGGDNHSLFVKTDGSVWSVGYNSYGQLGNGSSTTRLEPVQIATGIKTVAAGYNHSLLIKTGDTLWSTGNNSYGQLGVNTSLSSNIPMQVSGLYNSATAGFCHSLFIKTDNTLWVTGYNSSGQLGIGTTGSRTAPAQVPGSFSAASAGYSHSLLLKADNTAWATGSNAHGQLGDGTFSTRLTPVQIAGSYNAVSAGYYHSLFLKTDNTAWASGNNQYGQLGNRTYTSRLTPVQVLTNVRAIVAGQYHSLFLKNDNTLWGVGDGSSGQLGNGVYYIFSTPRTIAANVQSATAGTTHSLFIATGDIRYPQPMQPTVASFSPSTFLAGASVTISGIGYNGVTGVYFNGEPATSYTASSLAQITAIAPSGLTAGKIVVSTFDGYATSAASYTVISPSSSSSSGSSGGAGGGGGGGGGAPGLWFFAALGIAGLARRIAIRARQR